MRVFRQRTHEILPMIDRVIEPLKTATALALFEITSADGAAHCSTDEGSAVASDVIRAVKSRTMLRARAGQSAEQRSAGSSNCDWCCVSAKAESVLRSSHIE